MATVGELIIEKKNNFCKYLLSIMEDKEVIEKLNIDSIKLFKQNIDKLQDCDVNMFIYWVGLELKPQKDKLNEYVIKWIKINGIDYIPEMDKYKDKIISYIKLFIDLIDYTFDD